MPTFEEWWEREDFNDEYAAAKAAWDAATFAANNRAGDSANEGEKDARRKVAVMEACVSCFGTYGGAPARIAGELDAIIAKAQG